jgi:E3 ubiquitin-protein ligase RNF13
MMTLIYILWRIRQRQIRKAQLAPVSVVQNLPVKTIHLDQMKPNDPEVCAICLEDYIDDDQVRIMPCKHEFHIECIDPWLTKRKKFVSYLF